MESVLNLPFLLVFIVCADMTILYTVSDGKQ